MVENDFTGKKKFIFIFLQKWPQKGCGLGPKTPKIFQNFFSTMYLIENILKVTKYQHHMTVFKKWTVEMVRAWRNPPPPPPPRHE